MKVGLIGATGFIGQAIAREAVAKGHEVVGFSRSAQEPTEFVKEWRKSGSLYDLSGVDVVISVAGHSIDRRWTEENKRVFYSSRVGVTDAIVSSIDAMAEGERPRAFVNASAVGFYGDGGDAVLTEDAHLGEGYLAELCREWEEATWKCSVRSVAMRIGVVLGKGGAAYEKLLKVFQWGIGGKLGSGEQWMPWVHVDDLAAGFIFAAENESIKGPVNGVAPEPEKNKELTKKFASALGRPAIFTVPGFALKLVMGGFGGVLLAGQRAVPKVLESAGFPFRYGTLDEALEDLVSD